MCLWSGEDAVQAVNYGVDGILVSNHGARQLDGVPATVCVCASVCLFFLCEMTVSHPSLVFNSYSLGNQTWFPNAVSKTVLGIII